MPREKERPGRNFFGEVLGMVFVFEESRSFFLPFISHWKNMETKKKRENHQKKFLFIVP